MSETAVEFGNFTCSWQMPPKSGRRKNKGSGRAPASARPTTLGPPSGDVTPDNDGEDGTHDEAVSDSEIREAEPREATSSPPRFSQSKEELLMEEIMLLPDRLTSASLTRHRVCMFFHQLPTGRMGSLCHHR